MTAVRVDDRPAAWSARAGAFGIDVLFGLGAVTAVLFVGWSAPPQGWLWWVCIVVAAAILLAVAVNRLVLPVGTGWSLGRCVFGIRVVARDGGPVGPWRLLVRDIAHLLDTVPLCLGWLWPLIDSRGRTFADLLTGTEVRRAVGPRPDRREAAAAVIAGAAALAIVAGALGYFAVYRPQLAASRAKEYLAVEGPKIVADMLSYTAANADGDFARAQTLVTDGYRPELIKQQDAVRKAGLIDNDYWSSNSAVVSASGGRATMVLLLQGQRGAAPNQRFITASVRAAFEKSSSGQWQVSDLTVLAPPKPVVTPPASAPKPAPSPAPAPGKTPAPATPKPAPAPPTPKPAPSAPKPSGGGR